MADPTLFAGATVTVIGAITVAVVTVINAVSKAKLELLKEASDNAQKSTTAVKEIQDHVNGNLSEVKASLVTANERIAVLTERLLTTTATDSSRKR